MKFDDGFAPNPFHGILTLATCKPAIRRVAEIGDFIIGTGAKPRGDKGNLIYIMEVTEILSIEEYAIDPRFTLKCPDMKKNKVYQSGDNIYRFDGGEVIQLDSIHSDENGKPVAGHIEKDLRGENVLLSSNYVYYGCKSKKIPDEFRNCNGEDICIEKTGHRKIDKEKYPKLSEFIKWAYDREPIETMVMGRPSDWKEI